MDTSRKFTRCEVAQHMTYNDEKKDVWMIFHGKVYDVTDYVEDHPGGKEIFLDYAGQDGTFAFEDTGHSNYAEDFLKTMQIGVVDDADESSSESNDPAQQQQQHIPSETSSTTTDSQPEPQSQSQSQSSSQQPLTPQRRQPKPIIWEPSVVDLSHILALHPPVGIVHTVELVNTKMVLHEALVMARCPSLFRASFKGVSIDIKAVELFTKFLYSDEIPLYCTPIQWLGLAKLFDASSFFSLRDECLRMIRESCEIITPQCTAEDLIKLYAASLDIPSFDAGSTLCLNLLRTHKSELPLEKLPELLQSHPNAAEALPQLLSQPIENNSPVVTPTEAKHGVEGVRLMQALTSLLATGQGADFQIYVGKSHEPILCHFFVLQARWPYFRHLQMVSPEQITGRRIRLPSPGKEGGMHPACIKLILDVIYLNHVRKETREDFTAVASLYSVSMKATFLQTDDYTAPSIRKLFDEIAMGAKIFALETLRPHSSIELYAVAVELEVDDIAERAKKVIAENFDLLWEDPEQQALIFSLPAAVRERLLWCCLAATAARIRRF